MNTKTGAGLAGLLLGWLNAVPLTTRDLILVACGFVLLDTLTGFWAAALAGKARSRRLRTGLFAKGCQYAILGGIACGVSLLTRGWWPVNGCALGVVGIEFLSMVENARRLQMWGVKLGPIEPFVAAAGKYLAAGAEEAVKPAGDEAGGLSPGKP